MKEKKEKTMQFFQRIRPIETPQTYLDIAFHRTKLRVEQLKKRAARPLRFEQLAQVEQARFDVVRDVLAERIHAIEASFPAREKLPVFYRELMGATLDVPRLESSLQALAWFIGTLGEVHRRAAQRVRRTRDEAQIHEVRRALYGRVSSLVKRIGPALQFLEEARKVMKTYPILREIPTVAIAGFPNVGKTTLLSKLSSSRPEIAEYAFTTKHINLGYAQFGSRVLQLIDTPGTLARKDKMNTIELQAHLALRHLAQAIVFVVDPMESYPLEEQERLLQLLDGLKKPLVVYMSKTDVADAGQVKRAAAMSYPHALTDITQLKGQLQRWAGQFSSLEKPQ